MHACKHHNLDCSMGLCGTLRALNQNRMPGKCSGHQIPLCANQLWNLESLQTQQACHSPTTRLLNNLKYSLGAWHRKTKETILKQVCQEPSQLCCLWQESQDVDRKNVYRKEPRSWATLSTNAVETWCRVQSKFMKRAVQTLLFVCLETQQLPDTPNHKWMTALPCPIWRPCAGSPLSCSLIGTSHAYHLMIFQNLYTALQRQDTSNKLASCWGKNFNSNSAIPPFSIFKLSSSASVCQTMEKKLTRSSKVLATTVKK